MADINDLIEASRSGGSLPASVVVNPLQAQLGAAQTANTIFGVREKQAQQAAGQAFLDSINPDTGQPDQTKYLQLLKANPLTAMRALEQAQQGQTLDHNTYVTHVARINNGMGRIAQLLADHPGGPPADALQAAIKEQLDQGNLTPQQAQMLSGQVSNDPQANQGLLIRSLVGGLDAKGRLDAVKPPVTVRDTGAGFVPTVTSPQATTTQQPTITTGPGGVPKSLTPTETFDAQKYLQEPVEFPDQTSPGGIFKGTRLQWFQKMGVDPKMFYPAVPGGAGVPGAPPGTGLPSTLRNPAATPPAVPAAAPGSPAAPAAAPNPAGQPIPVPAASDLDYFRDVSARGVASRDRSAQLGNMLGDAAQFTTGPLAGIQSKLRNAGIAIGIPGINVEGQSAQESFNKLASAIALAQGSASDAKLNVATSANPHQELSPAGVQLIVKQLQGNEDYIQARAKLAANYNGTQRKFESEVASNLDPRAFQFARMEPAERQTWYKNLKKADQEAVQKSYNWAHEKGLIAGG